MNDPKMTDAISRSAAISDLRKWLYGSSDDEFQEGFDSALLGAINRLGNETSIPPLDVAPVVHARWIRDDLGNTRCSNCHTRLTFRHCYDDENGYEWDDEIDETPWCMYCGARMDGEAEWF